MIAGTEETTTGVIRLKALERDGKLGFPVDRGQRGEDEAPLRQPLRHRPVDDRRDHPRDERPARRASASSSPATAGVGRGVAMRAKGMGSHVIVTEVDPMQALEAVMDGFEVMPMEKAAEIGDIFSRRRATSHVIAQSAHGADEGRRDPRQHRSLQRRDRACRRCATLATETRQAREFVEEFTLADGRRLYLIADGRLVNLAAAEGHPAPVMDMSFANQALSAEYVVQNAATLEKKVYVVPEEIDNEIARLKLATMGVDIDRLTEEQAKYLASWDEGT